ncbi:MAG: hypothetical protein KAH46_06915 [Mycobacterium sp.]|nr:hypothetical protein [Mycobacterium sp.]
MITSLKGERSGNLIINQLGGTGPDGAVSLVCDDPLLRIGATYILAARFSPERRWYTVIPGAGIEEAHATNRHSSTVGDTVGRWRQAVTHQWIPRGSGSNSTLPPGGHDKI